MANEPANPEPSPKPRASNWRTLFRRSQTAIFVLNGQRRLRYANPAWEALTGMSLVKLRGTRFSATRTSASPLWATLGPPPEVWRGESSRVRRAAPGAEHGPPWWDIVYLPLRGRGDRILGAIGSIAVVGRAPPRGAAKLPAIFETLRHQRARDFTFDLLGDSTSVSRRLQSQLRWAADHRAPTWLIGEAGTGKESLARALHGAGPGRDGRFVAVECAGLQPYLIEGLLFGKGGLATGRSVGLLHLKNPAALPRDLQTRIAAWCASPAGPHLIAGSLVPVAKSVLAGTLIPAFQIELATLEVRLPPLRERLAELPRFLARIAPTPTEPEENVLRVLRAYSWPGNFHELASVWHDALRRAAGAAIQPGHLPRFVRECFLIESIAATPKPPPGLDAILESVERRMILRALEQTKGHQTDAAAKLGIFRTRLARRIEALGIVWPPEAAP